MEKTKNNYKKSGVNINLANSFVKHIARVSKKNVKKTKKRSVFENIGSFGSIYDLSKFKNHDVTFCGSLLEHLRDPVTAIEQLYSKTNNFCIIDISNSLTGMYRLVNRPIIKYTGAGGNFFHHSENAIALMMKAVGFKGVSNIKRYKIKIEKYGYKIPHSILIGYK